MRLKFFNILPLLVIVLLGIILRVVLINSSPPALNIDEAALGYNAYSILKTGADEHGKDLPLILESFGDWKLPLYVYTAIIPIALLGLGEFSTRIPSIVAGIVGIILIYYIAQNIFSKKPISLFAALFYALSPWNIYFSRAAYEVNLATTIFLGGLLLFLISLHRKNRKLLLILSGVLFGLTLFTYHSYIIFTPLFVACLSIYSLKTIKKKIIYVIAPLLIFIGVSYITNLSGGVEKASTTTIFTNKNIIYNRVENFRRDTLDSPILFDKIHTKYSGIPYQILQNYLNSFSPAFLFDRGGEKLIHNLDGFGNLYVFDALLLFAGISGMFYFREKRTFLILIWLVLAPIPCSITLDAPNSTRLFSLMPLFTLVAAYGAYTLMNVLRRNTIGKVMMVFLTFLFFVNVMFFINIYFVHFKYHRENFWRYGYKEMVEVSNKYPDKKIVMQGLYDFPYIYYLFYNKYDPAIFQKEATYYPISEDGFRFVKSFGRYRFVKALRDEKETKDTLYFDNQNFHKEDNMILLPGGDPVFKYYVGEN